METTRGWSQGKKHGDGGDVFSRGGRRRKVPISLPRIGEPRADAKRVTPKPKPEAKT